MKRRKPDPSFMDIYPPEEASYYRACQGLLEWRTIEGKKQLGYKEGPFEQKEKIQPIDPQSLANLEPSLLQQVADLWDKAKTRAEFAAKCAEFCEGVCIPFEPQEILLTDKEGAPIEEVFVSLGTLNDWYRFSVIFGWVFSFWKKAEDEGDAYARSLCHGLVSGLLHSYPTRLALGRKGGESAILERCCDTPAAWLALWSADLLAGNNFLKKCAKCGGWGTKAVMTHALRLEKEDRESAGLPLIGEIWLHNKSDSKAGKGKVQEDCYGIIMKRIYRAKQHNAPNNQPVSPEK